MLLGFPPLYGCMLCMRIALYYVVNIHCDRIFMLGANQDPHSVDPCLIPMTFPAIPSPAAAPWRGTQVHFLLGSFWRPVLNDLQQHRGLAGHKKCFLVVLFSGVWGDNITDAGPTTFWMFFSVLLVAHRLDWVFQKGWKSFSLFLFFFPLPLFFELSTCH